MALEIRARVLALARADAASLRAIRREVSYSLRAWPTPEALALARRLITMKEGVLRFIAYELIQHHPAVKTLNAGELQRLGRGMQSWEDTDTFGMYLAGPAWQAGQISTATIQRWARSTDRWWRRAALVSTVPLNRKTRGGQGDARRTLSVCRMLEADRDPMVVKALSWALRDLAIREPSAVRRYIAQRRAHLPALALREVRNKLETGLKNPRKRAAISKKGSHRVGGSS
jgi:3-methyladenine DNA glycosylase AlkD